MARIDKPGVGFTTSSEDTAGATTSIAIPAPRPGWAIRILSIRGYMRAGTSTAIRCNYQTAASTSDPVAINRDLVERDRSAGAGGQGEVSFDDAKGIVGGNAQQVTVTLNGNVADSTQCGLFINWDLVPLD